MPGTMRSIGAVVIHHDHFPEVLGTVGRLLDEGVKRERLVVVDNSEEASLQRRLEAALPPGVLLAVVENRGYGHAANRGVEVLARRDPVVYVLVSTHEALPEPGAVARLAVALDEAPLMAAAGPTLVSNDGAQSIYWSWGGTLSRLLNVPRHVAYRTADSGVPAGDPVVVRDWIDGAFCLYRADLLAEFGFDEDFFLYFEETDLHARFRQAGYAVGWVPAARVRQSSLGVPGFLLGRNLQRFQDRHGNAFQRRATVLLVILRRAVGALARRRNLRETGDIWRGWRSASRADHGVAALRPPQAGDE